MSFYEPAAVAANLWGGVLHPLRKKGELAVKAYIL
jgi:hypothetical protein